MTTDGVPDLVPYAGQWIALAGGRVAGVADTAEAAEKAARRARPDAELELREAPAVTLSACLRLPPVFAALRPILRGRPVWLVGGAVRDLLLGRPLHDLDFAVDGDGLALARRVADQLGAAFYPLDPARRTGRVVMQTAGEPAFVIDFAALRAPGGAAAVPGAGSRAALAADLAARDFALNAMALPPEAESLDDVIDPLGGRADLLARRIRATGPDAIRDDPNRVLRAFRHAATLGFDVDPETLARIRRDGPGLRSVSAERTRDEFIKLLVAPGAGTALRQIDELGLLGLVVPEVDAMRGVEQAPPHFEDVLRHTFTVFDRLDAMMGALGLAPARPDALGQDALLDLVADALRGFAPFLSDHLAVVTSDVRTRRDLLALGVLLHDCGKPQTLARDAQSGKIGFPEHHTAGAAIAVERARAMRLAAAETQWVGTLVREHMLMGYHEGFDRTATYRYFRRAGAAGVDASLLSLADQLAAQARLPLEKAVKWLPLKLKAVRTLLDAYFRHYDEIVAPPVLLTGSELMRTLGIRPGPRVGALLEAIREAQAAGEVASAAEAVALVRRLASEPGSE